MTYSWKKPKPHAEKYTFATAHGFPPEHTCFTLHTQAGRTATIHGDPNISAETTDALRQMVEHVYKLLDEGWKPGD